MFTGIVTDIGTIAAIDHRGDLRVRVATAYDTGAIDLGASIACSGACLTVIAKGEGWFDADVSAETVSRTAANRWAEGGRLNLERALRLGDELGGHIVTGHVDAVGTIEAVGQDGASHRVEVIAPAELAPYIAPKGSITIDGVSLTVNTVEDLNDGRVRFGVNIIPHTTAMTTLGEAAPGREVNLEIDTLARYLERARALFDRKEN